MSSKDNEFVNGLIARAPREGAPDFVKAGLSIKRLELIEWLKSREGEWVNVDIKEGKTGKWYCAINNWKPKEGGDSPRKAPPNPLDDDGDDIPF